MAGNTNIKPLIDELANAIIELETMGRSAQISSFRIQEEVEKMCSLKGKSNLLQIIYLTGSWSEGMPPYVCNDMDKMLYMEMFPKVCWKLQAIEMHGGTGGFVMAEHITDDPAYLKLYVLDKRILHQDFRSIIDSNGFLKSTSFIEKCFLISDLKNSVPETDVHGPSLTCKNILGNNTAHDVVFCLKCHSWAPIIDNYFTTRMRRSNWPSQQLLKKISDLDCLVVATGRPNSSSKDIEWRLSFSVAEKLLIQEMREPFANCMFALKAIKKKYNLYTDSDKPKPFCSYFIKTACFWLCETYPFLTYSIMDLIRRVLDWLIDCYKHRNLPHYFIPQQNLIGHLSRDLCDDACTKLTAVKKGLWKMVMSSIKYKGGNFSKSKIYKVWISDTMKISQVNEAVDYEKLECNLLKHPMATKYLGKMISILRSENVRSDSLVCQNNNWIKGEQSALPCHAVYWIDTNYNPSKILKLPQEILISIIENIEEIVVVKECRKMFKTCLYRFLGDIYTSLLICLRNRCFCEELAAYQNKPLHYYTLGAEMIWPDKSSDHGIGSQALVVKYHYLMGNCKALKEVLTEFKNTLLKVKKNKKYYQNRFLSTAIFTDKENDLTYRAWAADNILQHILKCNQKMMYFLHPIALVLYIMARVSLNEGDTNNASNILEDMKEYQQYSDNNILINIIEGLVGLLRVIEMISCTL